MRATEQTPLWIRIVLAVSRDENGCWNWQAVRDRKGYAQISVRGRTSIGHRVAFEQFRDPLTEGLELDHLCRNTSCVNPWHLEEVTTAENHRRRAEAITRCRNGHPYDEANTYIRPNGERDCRACIRARVIAYRQRNRVVAA